MKHPLHPALVHFPVACWSLGTLADATSVLHPDASLAQYAAVLLGIGCAAGLLAAVAGLVELLGLPAAHPAGRDASWHMALALTAWCLYAGSLGLRIDFDARLLLPPGAAALAASGLGFAVLLAAGWMGGKLVYGHGVGVTGRR
jgi:uncharacterized membrane protein